MKKAAIHIETEEYYDLYMGLTSVYGRTMCKKLGLKYSNLYHKHTADKKMIEKLDNCLEKTPDKIKKLNSVFENYSKLREKLNLRDWVPGKERYSIILNVLGIIMSVFTLPLVLLGLFNNWPHFFIPPLFLKGIKDVQFHSSVNFLAGIGLLIVYYTILIILAIIYIPLWWLIVIYIITLPATGLFAIDYRKFIIKSRARIRYTFGRLKKESDTNKLKENYDKLIGLTNQIVDTV